MRKDPRGDWERKNRRSREEREELGDEKRNPSTSSMESRRRRFSLLRLCTPLWWAGRPRLFCSSVEGERHRTLTWLLGIGLAVVEGVLLVHSFPFVCFFLKKMKMRKMEEKNVFPFLLV